MAQNQFIRVYLVCLLTAERMASRLKCLSHVFYLGVNKTMHCIHQSAVIPLHLAITGRPIRGGTRHVDMQKLKQKLLEQFAPKVPALIREDIKWKPKPNEKIIYPSTHCYFRSLVRERHSPIW